MPETNKCFEEMVKVLQTDGKIIISEKFIPRNSNLPLHKMLLRPFISMLGTDIGRSFEEICHNSYKNIRVEEDTPIMLNGMYRKIVIRKVSN